MGGRGKNVRARNVARRHNEGADCDKRPPQTIEPTASCELDSAAGSWRATWRPAPAGSRRTGAVKSARARAVVSKSETGRLERPSPQFRGPAGIAVKGDEVVTSS